jgi:hypothetical protein
MSRTVKEKRASFRKLHESGCFVLPNPWDVGSARLLEHLGFQQANRVNKSCRDEACEEFVIPRGDFSADPQRIFA